MIIPFNSVNILITKFDACGLSILNFKGDKSAEELEVEVIVGT